MKLRDLFLVVTGILLTVAFLVSPVQTVPAVDPEVPTEAWSFDVGARITSAEAQAIACKYISVRSSVISSTAPQHTPTGSAGANPNGGGTFTSTGQLSGRAYVTYCVPSLNSGGAQPVGLTIRVRPDGALPGVPTDGGTDPSVVLAIGPGQS